MKDKLDKEIATTLRYIQEVDDNIELLVKEINDYTEKSLKASMLLDRMETVREEYQDCLATLIKLRSELVR